MYGMACRVPRKEKQQKTAGANGVIYSRPRVLKELEKARLVVLQRILTIYCVGGGGEGGLWCKCKVDI